MRYTPNETTKAATEEANQLLEDYRNGKIQPTPIELSSVKAMLESCGIPQE